MSNPMITEHKSDVASILRTIESWLTGDGPTATREERLESAYRMIAASADEQHIPGDTIDAALAEGVTVGLLSAGEAKRYTGFVNSPLAAE